MDSEITLELLSAKLERAIQRECRKRAICLTDKIYAAFDEHRYWSSGISPLDQLAQKLAVETQKGPIFRFDYEQAIAEMLDRGIRELMLQRIDAALKNEEEPCEAQ